MLFLADAVHENDEIIKWTRRYLLGHRRILKKGRLYHTTPPPTVNPIFQKENGGSEIVISKPPFCAASPNSTVLLCLPAQLLQKRKETDAIKYKKIVSFFIFVHLQSTKALESLGSLSEAMNGSFSQKQIGQIYPQSSFAGTL